MCVLRIREGMAVLLSKMLLRHAVEWTDVSVKVKSERESWLFILAYGPDSKKSGEQMENFWID